MRQLLLLLLLVTALPVGATTIIPAPPPLSAKSYLLIDVASGEVLVEDQADLAVPPASLVKMMTSYVLSSELAAGRVTNQDLVTISKNAWAQNPRFKGASRMWLKEGNKVSLEDLHSGLLVASGCDAAVAIAEHLAGTEMAFVSMMNAHAEVLGMENTWYVNSHGLTEPDPSAEQFSTARDLAKLAVALMRDYPENYPIFAELEYTYGPTTTRNRNLLLEEDPSVDGLKTGYTEKAGYGLVASAERRGMRLVSVVLGSRSEATRKNETRSLLNYGFRFYQSVALHEAREVIASPKVWKGAADQFQVGLNEGITLTVPRGSDDKLDSSIELQEVIEAPVAEGDRLGTLKVNLDGELLKEVPLVALEPVEQGGFFKRLWHWFILLLSGLFQVD